MTLIPADSADAPAELTAEEEPQELSAFAAVQNTADYVDPSAGRTEAPVEYRMELEMERKWRARLDRAASRRATAPQPSQPHVPFR